MNEVQCNKADECGHPNWKKAAKEAKVEAKKIIKTVEEGHKKAKHSTLRFKEGQMALVKAGFRKVEV